MVDTRNRSSKKLRSRTVKSSEVAGVTISPKTPQRKKARPIVDTEHTHKARRKALSTSRTQDVVQLPSAPDHDDPTPQPLSAPSRSRNRSRMPVRNADQASAATVSSHPSSRPARHAKAPSKIPITLTSQTSRDETRGSKRKRVDIDEPCEVEQEVDALSKASVRNITKLQLLKELQAMKDNLVAQTDDLKAQSAKVEELERALQSCRSEKEYAIKEATLRERVVASKEIELQLREELLDEREALMELDAPTSSFRRAEEIMALLEDKFTCAICFDVLAAPYTLTPSRCGHTFCAVCILKWFFTHLHEPCGQWHSALECPLCRAELPLTPPERPRPVLTCPFTPNRVVNDVVKSMLDELATIAVGDAEADIVTQHGKKPRTSKKRRLSLEADNPQLARWRADGTARRAWSLRERMGRLNIEVLTGNWRNIKPDDFVRLKTLLGV